MRSEFEFIDHIKKSYGLNRIGDDCAVLPKDVETDLVITADMLIEDVDFKLVWASPKSIGHKALAVSLSDIAAMGAEPKWALLSIGVPRSLWKTDFVDEFYTGYMELAGRFNVELIGGDVSGSPDKLVLDSVVGGDVMKGKAVLRSGAKPGDKIFVTGKLGGAVGGLKLLENGISHGDEESAAENELLLRQLMPSPRVEEGRMLGELGISSMIDLSDGISSDLRHICNASVVGASIDAEAIPLDDHLDGSFTEKLDLALNGGEDFELLFTADTKKISADKLAGFTCVGEITANVGIIDLIHGDGRQILSPKGFQHFS